MDIGKLLNGVDLSLLTKLGELPAFMSSFGEKLADAGNQARTAANALVGDDGKGGAAQALAAVGATLDGCKQQLGTATGLLTAAADAAKAIPLMGGPAGQVGEGVQAIAKVVDQLGELGGHMRNLSEVVTTVGAALGGLGDRLGDSGTAARGFAAMAPPSR